MRFRPQILIILGVLAGPRIYAQEVRLDTIDAQLEHCLQDTTAETIPGMRQCYYLAYHSWDAEMNEVFENLLSMLSPAGQEVLRSSQRAWLNYRDAQFGLNNQIYHLEGLHGSLYSVTEADSNMELVKQRVVELRLEYEDLREGE